MRRLFGCPDIVSLTEKFLMARNFFRIFTENNPVWGSGKKYNIAGGLADVKGLIINCTYTYCLKVLGIKGLKSTAGRWLGAAQSIFHSLYLAHSEAALLGTIGLVPIRIKYQAYYRMEGVATKDLQLKTI